MVTTTTPKPKNTNWMLDIGAMHEKFGTYDVVDSMTPDQLRKFLMFRADCVQEEVNELFQAINDGKTEEIVDALVDAIVFAAGTLDLFGIDAHRAWASVAEANLAKEVGIKTGENVRKNEFGFPDLTKPEGWIAPSHEGNHGLLVGAFGGTQ